MADLRVNQPHSLDLDTARQRLGAFGELLARYGVRLEWDGPRAKLAGVPGVGGQVEVARDEVRVHVTLSRMVTMMGIDPERLEGSIRRRLAESLSG